MIDILPDGYRAQSEDTSVDIDRRLFNAYRDMPPWEKARRVDVDVLAVEHLALVGIRHRHPGATDREVRMRLGALRLDRETMVRVFGWDPEIHGY